MNSKRLLSIISNRLNSNLQETFSKQKYHDGRSAIVPNIFIATFGNFFMKVVLNERLPREKQHILHEYGNNAVVITNVQLNGHFNKFLVFFPLNFLFKLELAKMHSFSLETAMIGVVCLATTNGYQNFFPTFPNSIY